MIKFDKKIKWEVIKAKLKLQSVKINGSSAVFLMNKQNQGNIEKGGNKFHSLWATALQDLSPLVLKCANEYGVFKGQGCKLKLVLTEI